ncbi:hypothetical protein H4R19_000138 [Coemansia spiralis]|nr:hypothetical protein H4R19_000138 [Coemansia spiralis]
MGRARLGVADIGPTSLMGVNPDDVLPTENHPTPTLCPLMSEREQWEVGARLGSSRVAMGSALARRLRRRLELRRLRRVLGLRVFDIDSAVAHYMARPQRPWWPVDDADEGAAADDAGSPAQDTASAIEVAAADTSDVPAGGGGPSAATTARDRDESTALTPYVHSFASRLMGRAVLRDNLTATGVRVSPFHGRRLRPFIWRDFRELDDADGSIGSSSSGRRAGLPMLHVLRAIRKRCETDAVATAADRESIDYVHFQECHVRQANALLCRTFWPGIDVREALQYPEFSVVALYRRRVVGCAFLTPDAYVTYVAVAAGWEGAGIAKYMVYHLTQTLPSKDVTLHVSAANPAMLLYQQLGFKPETYVAGFYRDYLPKDSRACPHAFFMRLRRW